MAPRFKILPLWIRMLIALAIPALVFAAVEKAGLKFKKDGSDVKILRRGHCKDDSEIQVFLPPKVLQQGDTDFRYLFKQVRGDKDDAGPSMAMGKSGGKAESSCDTSIPDGSRVLEKFTADNAFIPARKFLTEGVCGKDGKRGTRVLCIYEGDGEKLLSFVEYGFNTKLGKIDDIVDKSAVDGTMKFTVKYTGEGSVEFITCYGKDTDNKIEASPGCDEEAGFKIHTSKNTDVEIPGLENFATYRFKVRIKEEGNPETPWFKSFEDTPVPATYPWTNYEGEGGNVQFSCQQTSVSSLLFFFVILLAWRLSRFRSAKNISLALVVALSVYMYERPSHAELGQMNMGILGSMYRPDLDSERLASGDTIFPFYKTYFRKSIKDKNGPINPLMGLEFDWHLWDGFGSVQLGFGVGYTYVRGRAMQQDASGQPDVNNPITAEKVSLHMYQIRPQLTYIFDPYIDYFPLAPYVRVGLIGHGFSFVHRNKNAPIHTTSSGKKIKPNGFNFGYSLAVGAMLRLNFLEPSSVKSARSGGFFDNVYLKAELSYTKIDGFGKRGYQFSPKDVMGSSLPLMWTFGIVFTLP